MRLRQALPQLATGLTLALLLVIASLRYKGFLSGPVFIDLLRDNAILGIVAIGMTFVILSGGIDLSVGAVVGLTSILSAKLMSAAHMPGAAVVAVVLVIGSLFGSFQGWIVAKFGLPPFLATLAGMFLARGLAFVTGMEQVTTSDPLYLAAGAQKFTLPLLLLFVLGLSLWVLRYRPFGRNVLAVGGSEPSALLMGVPVARVKVCVYAISGLCAALAGVAHGIYTSSGNASAGALLELDAIAAVVVGGTLLTGGVGSVVGTLIGVLVLGVIQTGITFEGTLNSWWTKIISGFLLLAFVVLQKLLARSGQAHPST